MSKHTTRQRTAKLPQSVDTAIVGFGQRIADSMQQAENKADLANAALAQVVTYALLGVGEVTGAQIEHVSAAIHETSACGDAEARVLDAARGRLALAKRKPLAARQIAALSGCTTTWVRRELGAEPTLAEARRFVTNSSALPPWSLGMAREGTQEAQEGASDVLGVGEPTPDHSEARKGAF
jgi:hypothetical protein